MRYVTAGESHGPVLTAIVSGVPAGLRISERQINSDLARRQSGYGRGGRQGIEHDQVVVQSGLRFGMTIGSPVTFQIVNRDWENWRRQMSLEGRPPKDLQREVTPRPGHADLVGTLKYDLDDCRDVLERASARETAARVAASAVAREFLSELGVSVFSYVRRIGDVEFDETDPLMHAADDYTPMAIELSSVRCPDEATSRRMERAIDRAKESGESLGGEFRVVVSGLVPGLGGYASPSDRLTSQIGGAIFSIPAVKGVEFGAGFQGTRLPGSKFHDPILHTEADGFTRASNNAGGLEGGMTTGMPLVVTAAMKPIPTLSRPLQTVNIDTLQPAQASCERSDVCAVPSCAVVAESEVAFVLANAYLSKFGQDDMNDIKESLQAYRDRVRTQSH